VCSGDALDDRQAEADTCVVGAYAFGAALERFGECRDQLWADLPTGVFDGEHDGLGTDGGVDLHGAMFGEVVDDRVVQEVRTSMLASLPPLAPLSCTPPCYP
jgi:hypothetical protein